MIHKKFKIIIIFLILQLFAGSVAVSPVGADTGLKAAKANIQESYGKLPLYFIENHGQVDKKVRFYEKVSNHATFFTDRCIYFSLIGKQQSEDNNRQNEGNKPQAADSEQQTQDSAFRNKQSDIVRLIPLGANKSPEIISGDLQEGRVNYLIGNNPEKWKTNIPTYKAVVYKNIYENIDMKFYGNNRQMEYDIIVKSGANPSRVQLSYQGIENLRITDEGELEVCYKGGKFLQKRPYSYQEIGGKRMEVQGEFKIHNSSANVRYPKSKIRNQKFIYGFRVASYDKRYPLIIDPALVYAINLGGSNTDLGFGIAVDTLGNAYITGETTSTNFPTESAFQGTYAGNYDAFVAKLDASGSSLVYSTYLGGSNFDEGVGIAVDTLGNAYITGDTASTNFPTESAFQGTNAGNYDAFVAKLDASGSSLVYSTYLGGSDTDVGFGIAVDISGNAYITGDTLSTDFPTASIFYGTNAGSHDAFVAAITLKSVPTVATGLATEVKYNSAVLNGIVNANGLSTTAWFEYGTTSELLTTKSSETKVSGTSTMSVNISLSGLLEDTLYYYSLTAENSDGTSTGSVLTFEAKPCVLESITLPEEEMKITLSRGKKGTVIVTATGEDNCPIKGKKITCLIDKEDKRLISVEPKKAETNINGAATFKIKTKNLLGVATVTFEADGIKSETLTVRVKR